MEQPVWSFGNEKRFYDFISDLGHEKIVLVSHTDIDGLSSAKIVNEVLGADDVFFIDYADINANLVQVLYEREAKKVIFTDLFFKRDHFPLIKEIESFAEILIIDHHFPELDFNSLKTVMMNAQGFCAAYLAYYLFSKIQDLSHFDWLVACASLADIAYRSNMSFMEQTMSKYGDKFEVGTNGQVRKYGKFWDYQWKISLALIAFEDNLKDVFRSITKDFVFPRQLEEKVVPIEKEYTDLLKRFDKENKIINGKCVWEFHPLYKITSFVINEISFRNASQTFIFISPTEKGYKFSTRRQDGMIDLNKLCQNLIEGFENSSAGGHICAAAGVFPKKYFEEFKKRLEIL